MNKFDEALTKWFKARANIPDDATELRVSLDHMQGAEHSSWDTFPGLYSDSCEFNVFGTWLIGKKRKQKHHKSFNVDFDSFLQELFELEEE